MNAMDAFRDDGPAVAALRRAGARLGMRATAPTALALLLLAALLAWPAHRLSTGAAIAALVACVALLGLGAQHAAGRVAWVAPVVVRVAELGGLLKLTAVAAPGAAPAAYALLAALAFHHYDTVYRLRHQGAAPPSWVRAAGGGWDGRLLAACAVAAIGVLGTGLWIAAAALGTLYVTESVTSWTRLTRGAPPPAYDDDDLEAA